MNHRPAVAGNDANGVNRLATSLGVQALQGEFACAVDMDPVVLALDP